ncbi:MAG: FAD-dependent oxidoreductase [Myxococcaceae bacterium]|nr:FAD-dependent oxidoreductase [Myxococcaceae bacterium]MCI0669640.1 FAD-dependent oxidoreductase [Myxococcaceae bacterium]
MGEHQTALRGPDLAAGVREDTLEEGQPLLGHAEGQPVLVVRRGSEVFAVGAECTHYGGPLDKGLVVGETVRCPWHTACFSLRTGEALRAPALNDIPRYQVERAAGTVRVTGRAPPHPRRRPAQRPESVLIIGAGAAGGAAAEMLRREGYDSPVTMLGADAAGPYDRPNLSKDYLAGTAPEDWIPLRSPDFYREQDIQLRTGTRVVSIDTAGRRVQFEGGETLPFGALLLATGAEPVRLQVPGADLPHVHTLRSLADSRSLIAAAGKARRVVVVGASFIGTEVAASLVERGLEVHIVAPEGHPFERTLGPQLGDFFRRLHEEKGARFHLKRTVKEVRADRVVLSDGSEVPAELVVVGIGVRPSVALAERAGLALDNGVRVNEYLQTSASGVWAAGDIARWPDPHSGKSIRVEHWVVAERQGQTAARNILGRQERFREVPFFWTRQHGASIRYFGHAEKWDRIEVDGSLEARHARVDFHEGGKRVAVVTVGRDLEGLRIAAEMEAAVA